MAQPTKQLLLQRGIGLLLQHGYHDLGIAALLQLTDTPKGSFYHHFASKQDYALQVIDLYMQDVHARLEQCLGDASCTPLVRIRRFFEASEEKYRQQGYLGCLLGGLGQELSGVSEVFRRKVEQCLDAIASRLADCLREAIRVHELPSDVQPDQLAELLVNCWEGAALRTRLRRDPAPLRDMLDFVFAAVSAGTQSGARHS